MTSRIKTFSPLSFNLFFIGGGQFDINRFLQILKEKMLQAYNCHHQRSFYIFIIRGIDQKHFKSASKALFIVITGPIRPTMRPHVDGMIA